MNYSNLKAHTFIKVLLSKELKLYIFVKRLQYTAGVWLGKSIQTGSCVTKCFLVAGSKEMICFFTQVINADRTEAP